MKALVFVYSVTKFQVFGEHPVRRFEPGTAFEDAPVAAAAGTESSLATGIYVLSSDSEKEAPPIKAITGRAGIDYDMVVISSKDRWPDPKSTGSQLSRIKSAFPAVDDDELNTFIYDDALGV